MKLDEQSYEEVLTRFLNEWPSERMANIQLEEYTDVGKGDRYCYQVEWGTEKLGSISGVSLLKFGIWKRKNDRDYAGSLILKDEEYSWLSKYGDDAQTAFLVIRGLINRIINFSLQGRFDAIDAIDFHAVAKWKIAFLYSGYRLLPIYTKGALVSIAQGLAIQVQSSWNIFEIQKRILEKKNNENVVIFAGRLWQQFVENSSTRRYFVIGTKYREEDYTYKDMFPEMAQKSVVATGFLWNQDLSTFLGKPKSLIDKYIEEQRETLDGDLSTVKETIFQFMHLRPGDLIALKSFGAYSKLTIIAYAQVIEKNGLVYMLDPDLGQCIHVDFLEQDLALKTGLNYGKTIQEVDRLKKPEHFNLIFGSYALLHVPPLEHSGMITNPKDGQQSKNITTYQRKAVEATTVNQIHNVIQNSYFDKLNNLYPDTCTLEYQKRVDIVRENATEIHYYEIKPYNSPQACIREGIGQLLQYHYLFKDNGKNVFFKIVGMHEPDIRDKEFINYMKLRLNIDFDYESHNPYKD